MNKNVLIIGSLNMDMVTEMERMPLVGETVLGNDLRYIPGGKGANQAAAAGSLGKNVTMLGCVGNDDFGKIQEKALGDKGVDVSRLKHTDINTGTAIIYVDTHGDNSIVVIQGANAECDIEYLKREDEVIRNCDYLLLQMEIPSESISYVINRASQLGKKIILNPAPAPDEIAEDILKKIDFITPNETELCKLAGGEGLDEESIKASAKTLLEKGVKNVIVTLGERGCLLVNENCCEVFPARKVEAIDTTAAGDCFNGAFVVALAEGKNVSEAIQFASIASSIAVTRKGASSSIPTREETDALT